MLGFSSEEQEQTKTPQYKEKSLEEKFMLSLPKILYGVLKEVQRGNALKALELKAKFEPETAITADDVDDVMNSDPAGSYKS